MLNDPSNSIFRLLLSTRQNWRNYGIFFIKKLDIIENNMIGNMVRESSSYDFRIIFNATSCKMIRGIQFFIYFWPPDKIDGIMTNYFNFFFNEK